MKIYLYVFCNKKFFLKLKIKFRGRLFLPRVCTDTQQSDKVMSMRRNHVAMYFYNLCKRWFSKSGDSNTFRASQLLRAIYSGSLDMMYRLFLAAYLAALSPIRYDTLVTAEHAKIAWYLPEREKQIFLNYELKK